MGIKTIKEQRDAMVNIPPAKERRKGLDLLRFNNDDLDMLSDAMREYLERQEFALKEAAPADHFTARDFGIPRAERIIEILTEGEG